MATRRINSNRKNKISARAILEGSNEKWYLERLKSLEILPQDLKLKSNGTRTNARSIVDKAITLYNTTNTEEETVYYVVLDVDNEPLEVFEGLDKQLKGYKDKIIPILSNPKIEYVLYCHFQYSDAIVDYQKKLSALKDIQPYEKSEEKFGLFCTALTQEHVDKMQKNLKQRDKALSFDNNTPLNERADKKNMPNSNFYTLIEASGLSTP